ncbi:MAG: biopolymer transporter ExbD [Gemmatimonadota bacterium]
MNAEINVTSLIDVAFTLLVIFIITAPILQGGLEIRLPRGELQPVTAQGAPFILDILEDGTVSIGDTPFTVEEFAEAFRQLYEVAQPDIVYIRGDARADYGIVFGVTSAVGAATREDGVPILMVGEPEPIPR